MFNFIVRVYDVIIFIINFIYSYIIGFILGFIHEITGKRLHNILGWLLFIGYIYLIMKMGFVLATVVSIVSVAVIVVLLTGFIKRALFGVFVYISDIRDLFK